MMLRRCAAGALAALVVMAGASGTTAAGSAASPSSATAPPPECITQTRLSPLLVPAWAFVMNFDVIRTRNNGAQYPVGCLIAWRAPFTPTDYVSIETCEVFGQVTFGGGQAQFNGGDVRCAVNVKAALEALNPPLIIAAEEPYPPFEIIGVGRIIPPTTPHPYSNPIAYYRPYAVNALPAGLFVPAIAGNDVYTIKSYFNGTDNLDVNVRFLAGPSTETWTAKHQPLPNGYQVQHTRDWNTLSTFFPRPLVLLRTDGATIYIGGSPLGPGFDGTLDEAIVDPPDRSGPTGMADHVTWVPVAMR